MNPAECLAVHDGSTVVEGLEGPVTITRDRWGIPHIRAGSVHDAFFAQGFCMAQDRAWQIEMIRHMAHGRAAEILGPGLLRLDQQNRRLGFGRYAAAEWERQSPAAREVLGAYAAGINAAIATQPQPYEFRVLGHGMAPWSPVDSLAIIKLVNSNQQWAAKLRFGQVAALLGSAAVEALLPVQPAGAALIVPSGARWTGDPHPFRVDSSLAMGEPDGPIPSGGGSNCWVIHGSRTASGAPFVAGDPHLPMSLPGQWYVVHTECPEFTAAGPCNPGYPGPVFYGHNTRVAWTMTHAQGDRWDLYRERIRRGPDGPEALFRDRWEALRVIDEGFAVRGGEAVAARTWLTRHGPVIHGDPTVDDEVVAARWGLADPAHDMDALLAMLRARTAVEARAALRLYDSVSGNYCFASVDGDIGYQYTGRIPRRPAWVVPVPGWSGACEWDGDVPRDELPAEDNPPNGFFVTANNRTTTEDYPYYLSYMATRFRADRLRELLDGRERLTLDELREFQADQVSIHARDLARVFAAAPAEGGAARLRDLFAAWDGSMNPASAAALAFDRVCEALAGRTVRAFFAAAAAAPEMLLMEERRLVYEQCLAASTLMLVHDDSWETAIGAALDEAAVALAREFGPDPAAWRWDAAHALAWRHNLGRSGELAAALNIPPVPVGGDANTPFNTAYERGGGVTTSVSYRQLFDLADLNAARICVPPGNSGQPGSPHYADHVDRWRRVEYHPLYIDWADIEASAEAHLSLVPR